MGGYGVCGGGFSDGGGDFGAGATAATQLERLTVRL